MSSLTAQSQVSAPVVAILRPGLTLVGWTFLQEVWMYKERIAYFNGQKIKPTPESSMEDLNKRIPGKVRWKADNYNHLHEAPLRFYTIVLALGLLHQSSISASMHKDASIIGTTEVTLAWIYVGLRTLHTLVQALINKIMLRFSIYILSELTMFALFSRVVLGMV